MERLESERPNFLDRFDLIAGTSTGGIIALAIAAGIAPERISAIYLQRAPSIFPQDLGDKLGPVDKLFRADYPNTGLRDCLAGGVRRPHVGGLGFASHPHSNGGVRRLAALPACSTTSIGNSFLATETSSCSTSR